MPYQGTKLGGPEGRLKTEVPAGRRDRVLMAVAEGFEPSDGGYPSHAFEACSLGRSDTPPSQSLRSRARLAQIAMPREEVIQQCRALTDQHSPAHLRPVGQAPVPNHIP
jgi:hypothetical protein